MKKIILASDHGGFELKEQIKLYLTKKGLEFVDVGAFSFDAKDNYPDFVTPLVKQVRANKNSIGIYACRMGTGPAMMANRFSGVRAAVCTSVDYAYFAREHQDANVLCVGGDVLTMEQTREVIDVFLNTKYGGGRHQVRIDAFDKLGEK